MTKEAFLAAYRARVRAYPWATDEEKLARFMASVAATLAGPEATWNHGWQAAADTWKEIGGKGKPSLKALRANQ